MTRDPRWIVVLVLVAAAAYVATRPSDPVREGAERAVAGDDSLRQALAAKDSLVARLEAQNRALSAAVDTARSERRRDVASARAAEARARELAARVLQTGSLPTGAHQTPPPATFAGDCPSLGEGCAVGGGSLCAELAGACVAYADSASVALDAYAREVAVQDSALALCRRTADELRSALRISEERASVLRPIVEAVAGGATRGGVTADTRRVYLGPAVAWTPDGLFPALVGAVELAPRVPLLGQIPLALTASAGPACASAGVAVGL